MRCVGIRFFWWSAVLLCLLRSTAFGQAINIDFGKVSRIPGDAFPGAALRSGAWNAIGPGGPQALDGLDGVPTVATVEVTGGARFVLNNAATVGEVDALLDDLIDLGPVGAAPVRVQIAGLRPGDYTVLTYAWAPDNPGYRSVVGIPASGSPTQPVGGSFPGGLISSVTHALHHVSVGIDGTLLIEVSALVGHGSLNGVQVVLGLPADDPEWRTITGTGNNFEEPLWGAAESQLLRLTTVAYEDGISEPSGQDRPNPREISNVVSAQDTDRPNALGVTDYFWQWGQFVDHDIGLTPGASPEEPFDIPVPLGDPQFDPQGVGAVIPLSRSDYDPSTGTSIDDPRQQLNLITSFIDASNVYGSDSQRTRVLRTNDGTGRLKMSPGGLLPFNHAGLPNAPSNDSSLFLAGDVRANEQVALTAMHTLFVREHNRVAASIAGSDPSLTGDQIFERARFRVGALMQVITYKEFLPILLGPDALEPYAGYRPDVNPGLGNVFSTAVYRMGHSLLSSRLLRLGADGEEIDAGHLPLRDAFFDPVRILNEGGIEPLLRGLSEQLQQELDPLLVDDVRNFLFGSPGAGGFDLASLNLQRGRDHGLPSFNQVRVDFGLTPVTEFDEITDDPELIDRLASVYAGVDDIDPWIGLAETPKPGAMVGELFYWVLKDQFERLRDGDRFWYQRVFDGSELSELEATKLSDVIRRNTSIADEIRDDVFRKPLQQDVSRPFFKPKAR